VARLDVDSFAVLLPETTPQAAAAIATTIHVDLANRAVSAGGDRHACTTSVGIDTYRGDQELTAAEFLARAETACARARRDGGSRTVLQGEASLQVRPA
jgi:diguanylate cyclase